jgi:hypothetical protein
MAVRKVIIGRCATRTKPKDPWRVVKPGMAGPRIFQILEARLKAFQPGQPQPPAVALTVPPGRIDSRPVHQSSTTVKTPLGSPKCGNTRKRKYLWFCLVIELQKIEDAYARLDEFLEQPCHQRPWQEFQRLGGVTS